MTSHIEIHTRDEDTATVDGRLIHRGGYDSIYHAAIALATTRAQDEARKVLVKAIDGAGGGAVSWVTVDPEGVVGPADPPESARPADGRRRRHRIEPAEIDESDFYTPSRPTAPTEDQEDPYAVAPEEPEPAPVYEPPATPPQDDTPPADAGYTLPPDDPHTDPTTGPIPAVPAAYTSAEQDQARREPYVPADHTRHVPDHRNTVPPPPHRRVEPRPPQQVQPPATFLNDTVADGPEVTGFNAFLRKLGFKTGPTDEQKRLWEWERIVSQHWGGPRTVAVANGKGGSTKTPTTAMLAAVFARYGGSGVAAWDANFTRGTLGWRTEQGPHDRTVLELVPHLQQLLSPSANSADLAGFLHHQTQDKYDVLRSNPRLIRSQGLIRPGEQDAVHQLLTKHYRLVLIDSGNDESAEVWTRMIDHSDALVVPTLNRRDHAEAALEMLTFLREQGGAHQQLAQNAVVVISAGAQGKKAVDPQVLAPGFSKLARAVVVIPYDDELDDQWLRYGNLAQVTQRAWLGAAAAVAHGLTDSRPVQR